MVKNGVSEIKGLVFGDLAYVNLVCGNPADRAAGPHWRISVAGQSSMGSATAWRRLGRSAGRRLERTDFLNQICEIQRELP